MEQLLAT
jgi:hypothetical protein